MADISQWTAPGRVNLIGEHLDYNAGPVLPIAIERGTTVKARRREDAFVHAWTTYGGKQHGEFALDVRPGELDGWLSFVAAVFWSLCEAGHQLAGFDLVIDSDLPVGAGLSSSAALECAIAGAVNDQCGLGLEPLDLALIAHRGETGFVGVPSGAMDQIASACAQDGAAMLINTSVTPPTIEQVPVDWSSDGLELVVIDTRVSHDLSDGGYASRRDECAQAATALGLESLALAGPDAVLRLDDEKLKARTRHVITETARTRGARRALGTGNWTQFGAMLTASHESLRDDFAVSCMELDIAVDVALSCGALGARMTGAGFGGSAIALVAADRVGHLVEAVSAALIQAERAEPSCFTVRPSGGLRRS